MRGWTLSPQWERERRGLLPARAGMDPAQERAATRRPSRTPTAPRACGDGPRSPVGFFGSSLLLPARAGMDPPLRPAAGGSPPAPRACGDGPPRGTAVPQLASLLPARAGMDLRPSGAPRSRRAAPRACGDGPDLAVSGRGLGGCSPRVRGWTPPAGVACTKCRLLPARAGMDPRPRTRSSSRAAAPRACGDGPSSRSDSMGDEPCSPRVRGWTHPAGRRRRAVGLLPARAGMNPWRPQSPLTLQSPIPLPHPLPSPAPSC